MSRMRFLFVRCNHNSPRAANALMRSAVRQAIAWMVSDGLTPRDRKISVERRPHWWGATSGGLAALCRSMPATQQLLWT